MVHRVVTSVLVIALSPAALLAEEAPVIAVFPIEDSSRNFSPKAVVQLGDYLSVKLAETGRFKVVPKRELEAQHRRWRASGSIAAPVQSPARPGAGIRPRTPSRAPVSRASSRAFSPRDHARRTPTWGLSPSRRSSSRTARGRRSPTVTRTSSSFRPKPRRRACSAARPSKARSKTSFGFGRSTELRVVLLSGALGLFLPLHRSLRQELDDAVQEIAEALFGFGAHGDAAGRASSPRRSASGSCRSC
jgi:hypothetical protein